MKRIAWYFLFCTGILFPAFIHAQQHDFEKEIRRIDSLLERHLPKDAEKQVDRLLNQPNTRRQAEQFLPLIRQKTTIIFSQNNNAVPVVLRYLDSLLREATPMQQSILHLYKAEHIRAHISEYSEQLESITDVDEVQLPVENWSLKRWKDSLFSALDKALQTHQAENRKTPIDNYKALFSPYNTWGAKALPTLWDAMCYKSIQIISSLLSQPLHFTDVSIAFERYLLPNLRFTTLPLSPEELSPEEYHLIRYIQQAMQACAETNFASLCFWEYTLYDLSGEAVQQGNPSAALAFLHDRYTFYADKTPLAGEWLYRLTEIYDPSNNYVFNGTVDKVKALALVEEGLIKYANTPVEQRFIAKKRSLTNQSLYIEAENVVAIGQEALLRVVYTNVDSLFLNIYAIPKGNVLEMLSDQDYRQAEVASRISKFPLQRLAFPLPKYSDLSEHSTMLALPALSQGCYVLMVENFRKEKETNHSAVFTWRTNLLPFTYNKRGVESEIACFNRKTDKPEQRVAIYPMKPDRQRDYVLDTLRKVQTDKSGKARLQLSETTQRYYPKLWLEKGNDYFFTSITYFAAENEPREYNKRHVSSVFTDRAIYRPGQTVQFSVVAYVQQNQIQEAITNAPLTATLLDANGKEVSQQMLTTNGYGSASGTFALPLGRNTGSYAIRINDMGNGVSGNASFQVEEYKRPTFEVVFDTLSAPIKFNDSVTIHGRVIAYAGYPISQAKVSYSLNKQSYFPYRWHYFQRTSSPLWERKGNLETDEDGRFALTFFADKGNQRDRFGFVSPVQFSFTAQATDMTGETQSGEWNQMLSEQEYFLDMPALSKLDKDALSEIAISVTNINKKPKAVPVEIECLKLPEGKATYAIFHAAVDTMTLSEEEFSKRFPHVTYPVLREGNLDRDAVSAWKMTVETDLLTGKAVLSSEKFKTLASGNYVIRARINKDGKTVSEIVSEPVTVYSIRDEKSLTDKILDAETKTAIVKTGDTLALEIFSGAEAILTFLHVHLSDTQYQNRTKTIYEESFPLNNSRKRLRIPIDKNYEGDLEVLVYAVKYGRLFEKQLRVCVEQEKKIDLTWQSFRSTLLPNQQEEWVLKIENREKLPFKPTELLAGMYDQSLDLFASLQWSLSTTKPYYRFRDMLTVSPCGDGSRGTLLQHHPWGKKTEALFFQFPLLKCGNNRAYNSLLFEMEIDEFADLSGGKTLMRQGSVLLNESVELAYAVAEDVEAVVSKTTSNEFAGEEQKDKGHSSAAVSPFVPRKNFAETAFFYPHLHADSAGEFHIRFTVPESLTRWRVMAFAHDKNMHNGFAEAFATTSKQVMAHLNIPRFLREGDTVVLTASVYNNTFDTVVVDPEWRFKDIYGNAIANFALPATPQRSVLQAKATERFQCTIVVPQDMQAVTCAFIAKAKPHSDGEEKTLPILSNRLLVTESLPMYLNTKGEKNYTFDKLAKNTSSTLKNHKFVVEYTSQPIWNAILALPYLMEYPYECNEQIFSRYYANTLAGHIIGQNPSIKKVFDQWNIQSPQTLLSQLDKNQELKQLLIEETPWLQDANSETEQRKRIAQFFDLNQMANQQLSAVSKLQQGQNSDGGFPWFSGGQSSFYITAAIVGGYARLEKIMGEIATNPLPKQLIKDAVQFLDQEQRNRYEELKKGKDFKESKNYLSPDIIYYFYARSFFTDQHPVDAQRRQAFRFWLSQIERFAMMQESLYMRALSATTLYRMGKDEKAVAVAKSLTQNLTETDEMGLFPIKSIGGYHWSQSPIETQAALIEVFDEVVKDRRSVAKLQTWLINNKRTESWATTKATVDAIYALLIRKTDLQNQEVVHITVGGKPLPTAVTKAAEAGSGYLKTQWNGNEITKEMAQITISKTADGSSWGAAYWQYFEDLDKITAAETGVKIAKRLYVVSEDQVAAAKPMTAQTILQAGQRVRVVLTLEVDRPLEYVHLKDMRAAGLEPIYSPSRYYHKGQLAYYQSIRDAASHFFIDYLPKGTHVFEYDLRIANAGHYSTGITTIQCMYAPEFTAHTKGMRMTISPSIKP